jgi:hypothetical protein
MSATEAYWFGMTSHASKPDKRPIIPVAVAKRESAELHSERSFQNV